MYKQYPHNPPHLFIPNSIYMITSGLINKKPILDTDYRKQLVCDILFQQTYRLGWILEAWAVLSNHYHFIARSPDNVYSMPELIRSIHSMSSVELNRMDLTPGRKLWHNYWDTCITDDASYKARLLYVHANPLKHKVVKDPLDYKFCSYQWFTSICEEAVKMEILSHSMDRLNIPEKF